MDLICENEVRPIVTALKTAGRAWRRCGIAYSLCPEILLTREEDLMKRHRGRREIDRHGHALARQRPPRIREHGNDGRRSIDDARPRERERGREIRGTGKRRDGASPNLGSCG